MLTVPPSPSEHDSGSPPGDPPGTHFSGLRHFCRQVNGLSIIDESRIRPAPAGRERGLHPGHELLLMHLRDAGPQRQGDLAMAFDADSATMTRSAS
jgi:hypothetical protein